MEVLKRIALIVLIGLLLAGCVSKGDYKKLGDKYNADIAGMSGHIKELKSSNETLTQENQKMSFEIKTLQLKNEELEGKIRQYEETLKTIQGSVISQLNALKDDGISINDKGAVDIQGEVLFDPGEAKLKQRGKDVLKKIAEIIKSEPSYMVQIAGFTDSDKIEASAEQWKTRSNFELAAYRALSVLLCLEEQGVDPARLYLSSFGEYHPKGDKKSENRRVEISFTKLPVDKKETPVQEKSSEPVKEPSK